MLCHGERASPAIVRALWPAVYLTGDGSAARASERFRVSAGSPACTPASGHAPWPILRQVNSALENQDSSPSATDEWGAPARSERAKPAGLDFSHIVFPRELARRKPLNLAPPALLGDAILPPLVRLAERDRAFCAWLFARAGLDVDAYRDETLERRLPACLRALRADSIGHARELIERDARLLEPAISALLVGVTSFFRDPHVFDQLERDILPHMARARGGLYFWSLGCSDGAELYSLAIQLAERDLLLSSHLVGADCRSGAIAAARHGLYDNAALRHVTPQRMERFFRPRPRGWQVVDPLRRAARFRASDLLKGLEPGFWDLIAFRNTSIYLRSEATAGLWERLESALRLGGVLMVGKAEKPAGARRLAAIGPCLYQRVRR